MTEQILQAKKDYSRFSIALLAIAVITSVLQLILGFVMNRFLPDTALEGKELLRWILTMAPMYLVAVPMGFLLMRKIPAESQQKQKLSFGRFLVLMLICMPIMYGGNIIGNILSALLSGGTAENALLDYIMGNPFYAFLFTVVLAPFLEELIFRKQIVDRLGKYGEKTAIIFSAVAFGLFHMNLFQFFYAFGLGLIFAYVYSRTRMLRYTVIMHAIINFMGSIIAPALLKMLDLESLASTGTATTEQMMQMLPGLLVFMGYFCLLIASAIAGLILLIIRWKERKFLPASQELPAGTAAKTVYGNVGTILFIVFCLIMTVLALF